MSLIAVIQQDLRSIASTLSGTLTSLFKDPIENKELWSSLYQLGYRSVFFVLLTLGFLGAIMNLQTGYQAQRILGDCAMVGEQMMPLLVRQLAPTLTGLMVATRVGSGIEAELGSMVVTEQVDALRMCGASPIGYLLKPRFLACMVMVPALTVFGGVIAFVAGLVVSGWVFGIQPASYACFDQVNRWDVWECCIKAFVFSMVIPIVSGSAGLNAYGGSEGVGEATTKAVVESCLAVIMLDLLVGGVIFLLR